MFHGPNYKSKKYTRASVSQFLLFIGAKMPQKLTLKNHSKNWPKNWAKKSFKKLVKKIAQKIEWKIARKTKQNFEKVKIQKV